MDRCRRVMELCARSRIPRIRAKSPISKHIKPLYSISSKTQRLRVTNRMRSCSMNSLQDANRKYFQLDARSPWSLYGLVDKIVSNGAHLAKNPESANHNTILWLDTAFTIRVSATPIIKHARDYEGFLNLIEVKGQ